MDCWACRVADSVRLGSGLGICFLTRWQVVLMLSFGPLSEKAVEAWLVPRETVHTHWQAQEQEGALRT